MSSAPDEAAGTTPEPREDTTLLSSSAVMAAGTVVSRLSGFVRNALLAAAIGFELHADVFNIANTVPNMLYILLAGGLFNAVLVPQLVRAMKNDADGGEAYAQRIVTLAGLFLACVTAVLVIAAPLLMRLFLGDAYFTPELAEQRESVIAFARYCLPQVFFYGMFVLLGQILISRGRFAPMMWAPIANNVLSIGALVAYLFVFGPAAGKELTGGFTPGQELLLGLGSTLGIVAQFLVLLPYVRAVGFRYRPRYDFRGSGLGHTLRLGVWTVLFVVVNQVAYTVVVNLASSGTADAVAGAASAGSGTGYSIYSSAFLVIMVPHSIITVSLATAVLPRLSASAADGDLGAVSRGVASTLRQALALIVPVAVLIPIVALDVASLIWGYGAASSTYPDTARALALFAPGLVLFTSHYLILRGFFSLERTRTVFWIQCVIAGTNIVLALALTRSLGAEGTAFGLVLAYGGAYLAGVLVSYLWLRHVLGGLETGALARFVLRLLVAVGVAGLAGWAVRQGLERVLPADGKVGAVLVVTVVTIVGAAVYLAMSRVLHLGEVTAVLRLVTGRLRR